jgi:hypothetical protein
VSSSFSFLIWTCTSVELRFRWILSNSGIFGRILLSSRAGLRRPADADAALVSLRVSSDSQDDSILPSPLLLRMCSAKCFRREEADENRALQSVQLRFTKGPVDNYFVITGTGANEREQCKQNAVPKLALA